MKQDASRIEIDSRRGSLGERTGRSSSASRGEIICNVKIRRPTILVWKGGRDDGESKRRRPFSCSSSADLLLHVHLEMVTEEAETSCVVGRIRSASVHEREKEG